MSDEPDGVIGAARRFVLVFGTKGLKKPGSLLPKANDGDVAANRDFPLRSILAMPFEILLDGVFIGLGVNKEASMWLSDLFRLGVLGDDPGFEVKLESLPRVGGGVSGRGRRRMGSIGMLSLSARAIRPFLALGAMSAPLSARGLFFSDDDLGGKGFVFSSLSA